MGRNKMTLLHLRKTRSLRFSEEEEVPLEEWKDTTKDSICQFGSSYKGRPSLSSTSPPNKSLSSMGGGLGLGKSFWKGGGIEMLKEISDRSQCSHPRQPISMTTHKIVPDRKKIVLLCRYFTHTREKKFLGFANWRTPKENWRASIMSRLTF